MKIQTAILTVFFLFLFMGSASAGYVGTIETWTNTLTCTTREWGEIETWTETLTASEVPGEDWEEVHTWTETLTSRAINTDVLSYANSVLAEIISWKDLSGQNSDYSTAQTVYTGASGGTSFFSGQYYSGSSYTIWRGVLQFDLTDIEYEFGTALIGMTGFDDYSTTDFNMLLVGYTEPSLGSNNASYNGYGATTFGSFSSADYDTDYYDIAIELNASGIAYLNDNLGEVVTFMLVSDKDMSDSPPTDSERLRLYSAHASNGEEYYPTLFFDYAGGDAWEEIETWTETLTVSPYAEWSTIETWNNTLTVSGDEPPYEPLIPYDKLTSLILPIALLFIPAGAFATRFGSTGFMLGAGVGLILLWTTAYISLGLMVLGGMAIAAIYMRLD